VPAVLPCPVDAGTASAAGDPGGDLRARGQAELGQRVLDVAVDGPRRDRQRRGDLERDDFPLNRHPAPAYWWSMIFSENRYPLFGIML